MAESPAPVVRSKPILFVFLGVAACTFIFGVVALLLPVLKPRADALSVYCAASAKAPMEQIAADYSRATGVPVDLSFGGSQTLLANIEISQRGDLYLPADDSYLVLAQKKNLIRQSLEVAEQAAVIAVPKGNPKGVQSLSTLLDTQLTLAQANPETAAMGKLLRDTLAPRLWLAISNRTVVFKPNVSDAANDAKLGAVDAAIVWDSMRKQYPELEFIRAPELATVRGRVAIAVLTCSRQPQAAQKFAAYVASKEQGMKRFVEHGFTLPQDQP